LSPSNTYARLITAALTAAGTLAVVAGLAIGLTGWPPTRAVAEPIPETPERSLVTTTAAFAVSPPMVAVKFTTSPKSFVDKANPKSKSLKKAPGKKPVAKKKAKKKVAKARYGSWSSARVSWYGPGFYGHTMAGGGKLTRTSMVVAHRSLPFGTRIQFAYRGRTVTAVVRDRGPYIAGRTFDLGPGTARSLGFGGVGTVKYRIVKR